MRAGPALKYVPAPKVTRCVSPIAAVPAGSSVTVSPPRRVRLRPPTRSRASTTVQSYPALPSSYAHASPATPAPSTSTFAGDPPRREKSDGWGGTYGSGSPAPPMGRTGAVSLEGASPSTPIAAYMAPAPPAAPMPTSSDLRVSRSRRPGNPSLSMGQP